MTLVYCSTCYLKAKLQNTKTIFKLILLYSFKFEDSELLAKLIGEDTYEKCPEKGSGGQDHFNVIKTFNELLIKKRNFLVFRKPLLFRRSHAVHPSLLGCKYSNFKLFTCLLTLDSFFCIILWDISILDVTQLCVQPIFISDIGFVITIPLLRLAALIKYKFSI